MHTIKNYINIKYLITKQLTNYGISFRCSLLLLRLIEQERPKNRKNGEQKIKRVPSFTTLFTSIFHSKEKMEVNSKMAFVYTKAHLASIDRVGVYSAPPSGIFPTPS